MQENSMEEIEDQRNMSMFNLASQLKAGKGLAVAVSIFEGDATCPNERKRAQEIKQRLKEKMADADLIGFAMTLICNENQFAGSISTMIQGIGIGGLRPNTIMVGWPYPKKNVINDPEYRNFLGNVLLQFPYRNWSLLDAI